jgi:hypothetical protein
MLEPSPSCYKFIINISCCSFWSIGLMWSFSSLFCCLPTSSSLSRCFLFHLFPLLQILYMSSLVSHVSVLRMDSNLVLLSLLIFLVFLRCVQFNTISFFVIWAVIDSCFVISHRSSHGSSCSKRRQLKWIFIAGYRRLDRRGYKSIRQELNIFDLHEKNKWISTKLLWK